MLNFFNFFERKRRNYELISGTKIYSKVSIFLGRFAKGQGGNKCNERLASPAHLSADASD